jgi:hypothetical protein
MALIFCSNCGAKAEYNFSAPNFCSKCGQPYSGIKKHSTARIKNEIEEEFHDNNDEDEEIGDSYFSNSVRVPKIRNIEVEVSPTNAIGARTVKMSDLINGNYSQQPFKAGNRQNLNDAIDERKSN